MSKACYVSNSHFLLFPEVSKSAFVCTELSLGEIDIVVCVFTQTSRDILDEEVVQPFPLSYFQPELLFRYHKQIFQLLKFSSEKHSQIKVL